MHALKHNLHFQDSCHARYPCHISLAHLTVGITICSTCKAIGASPPVGQVYQTSVETFLPTPLKSHYLFNMRDVAKVIEGIMQVSSG